MRPLARLAASALACVCAAGCGATVITDRDQMKAAFEEFNDGIRWGKIDQSAAHLPVERRAAFADRWSRLEDELEVMDYEIQRVDYDREKDRAIVRVELSWSMKRRGLVERTVVEEEWKNQRGWVMLGAKHVKGSRLEPLEAPPPAAPTTPPTNAATTNAAKEAPVAPPSGNAPAAAAATPSRDAWNPTP